MGDGVIVGADHHVEWLIPWWWMNYSLNNTNPVTFINFGSLTDEMIKWCSERGVVQDYQHPDGFVIDDKNENQVVWIKKPFAMMQSPYDRTVWFDLDCWIRDSIGDIFEFCENSAGLGIIKEPKKYQIKNLKEGGIKEGETIYNAGVIVYKKGSQMMKLWTNELLTNYSNYYADQDTLSRLLCHANIPFTKIDPIYNWFPDVKNLDAKVFHLIGISYKKFIKKQIMFLKFKLFVNFP